MAYRIRAFLLMFTAVIATEVQAYPDKPIRLVVGFPPGGAADLVARAIGQRVAEQWRQVVIIDNRSGAGGVIGTETVARATPDGYTLLFGSSSNLSIGPALQPNLPYKPDRDFAAVTLTTLIPNILVAHASVPVRSVKELIEYAKAKPKQLSYASNGNGTISHIAGELFSQRAGIRLIHVPYKGAGVAINDALGGHVQFLIGAISTSLPHIRAGKLRGIAVTGAKRTAAVADLPTIAESGFPGFEVVQWFGLVAPAKTPADIVKRWNEAVVALFREDEFSERFRRQGLEPATSSPQEFAAFMRAETAMWGKVFKEVGISLQ